MDDGDKREEKRNKFKGIVRRQQHNTLHRGEEEWQPCSSGRPKSEKEEKRREKTDEVDAVREA